MHLYWRILAVGRYSRGRAFGPLGTCVQDNALVGTPNSESELVSFALLLELELELELELDLLDPAPTAAAAPTAPVAGEEVPVDLPVGCAGAGSVTADTPVPACTPERATMKSSSLLAPSPAASRARGAGADGAGPGPSNNILIAAASHALGSSEIALNALA